MDGKLLRRDIKGLGRVPAKLTSQDSCEGQIMDIDIKCRWSDRRSDDEGGENSWQRLCWTGQCWTKLKKRVQRNLTEVRSREAFVTRWPRPGVYKRDNTGTSLAVQWLRLHLLMQRVWVQSLGAEPRSQISAGALPLSHVWLFVTPWPVAHQAPLSMAFSRQ